MTYRSRSRSDLPPRDRPTSSPRPAAARRRLALLGGFTRGLLLGGAAFLLGSCPLLLGSAPLGIAILSAASAYTWYVLAGVLLSALLHPVTLSGWAWTGVYLLCIILRLILRLFVDPPSLPDGRPCRGRVYLRLCWASFQKNAGLLRKTGPDVGDTVTDYYSGAPGEPGSPTGRMDRTAEPDENPAPTQSPPFSPRLFLEHPLLRLLVAAICGFTAGLFGLISGGFHVYDLLSALCLLVLSPLAAFLLISCFGEAGLTLLFDSRPLGEGSPRRKDPTGSRLGERFHALPLISVCFLLAMTVYAARGFTFSVGTPYLTVHTATLLGLLLTLFASVRLGIIPGVAVGGICGLAADPVLSPLFILCAGAYALFRYVSHKAGVVAGCTVGAIWCAAAAGVTVLAVQLPAILLTAPLYLVLEKLQTHLPAAPSGHAQDEDMQDMASAFSSALAIEARSHSQRARMKALSEAFEALSHRFYDLSSQLKRPRMLDLRRICDESFGKLCAHCKDRDVCWGAEYDRTLEIQARLTSQLHAGGRADMSSLPDSLVDFCPHMEELITDVNGRCARMTEILLKSEKTEVFAADYASIAALLSEALEEDRRCEEDFACNREAADRLYEYLTREGVAVQGVVVGGKRKSRRQRVIIRGRDFTPIEGKMDEVRAYVEELCGAPMGAPVMEPSAEEGDGIPSQVMTLRSEALLSAAYAGSTVPAGHDRRAPLPPPLTHGAAPDSIPQPGICGDHIALFRTPDAYFYALISDGMGSGEDASLTSDICTVFLEKMLTAGNRVEISLRMLDSIVRSKNTGTGDECSATVDLMELDLMDGQAVFAKNGAAPTYVVRDGTVYKLRSHSLPIGILSRTPPQLLRFRMHPGDVVVMVSDGVTLGNDECPWLIDLLSSPMPESMDSLRKDIIRRALSAGSEDDLSAIAIRVEDHGR